MTYCFTSGTTGIPKGAIHTHFNFVSQIYSTNDSLGLNSSDVHLSYLPLAHLFERCIQFTLLS
jgi:long-chain acyl-CoA synthetase